ncbi:MAG: phosphatase PAP2 family protein [Christensenellales bacterium]|jgi:membrane-associated phospholipid phosphatase
MGRRIPNYARLPLLICLAAQFLAYYIPRTLPPRGVRIEMALWIDARIGVYPIWVIIYIGAYLFWVWGYVAILSNSRADMRRFFAADIVQKAVAALCFILLPTHLHRPALAEDSVFAALTNLIYRLDPPDNLFPSMHTSVSWLIARSIGSMRGVRPACKAVCYVCAALVMLSALFTGQHVVLDLIGGVALAEGALILGGWIETRRRRKVDHETTI